MKDWAIQMGCYYHSEEMHALLDAALGKAGGQEHDVFMFAEDDEEGYVIRLTKDNFFARPGRTPGEYLMRWYQFNRLFPQSAVEFLGYCLNAWGNGVILTRQPLINGTKRSEPDVGKAMAAKGFTAHPDHDFAYIHEETGLEIHDAHQDNVLFDAHGNILPIDVWVDDPNGLLLE